MIVPKARNEILGVVIVESGWGSMLPTVVIANLAPAGAAARCGQLNIGDQIIAINGISLVGLPLSTCQTYIKVRDDSISFITTRRTKLSEKVFEKKREPQIKSKISTNTPTNSIT